MTSEQLTSALRDFLDRQTGEDWERRFLRAAFDLRDAVRDRVQSAGLGPDGRPFAPYTSGYARERLEAGFQIRKVTYTRSGRLWGSIIPEVVSRSKESITIEVAPRGRENEVKLLGPGATKPRKDGVRRGLITLPNDEEIDEMFETLVDEILEDFQRTVQ